ncbi:MAG: PIN domain-containing protein [Planctomycetaceae bacterium]|jgi:predicted nucleic acid-binding protein|nr:PIN domain-containing protein [Planctomycetaceae bacterium]
MTNRNRIRRVYPDTSVVGGAFDEEFRKQTYPFWNAVNNGEFHIIVSDILKKELERAPKQVMVFFENLPESQKEYVIATEESDFLADQYIAAKVVGQTSRDDCRHIAIATINRADVLVSWNFKHIVNVNRICGYNGVNMLFGYPQIEIRTPSEVIYET